MSDCAICRDNAAADAGEDPRFVARTQTGYVRLHDNQYYRGLTLFASQVCVREPFELDEPTRTAHLREMVSVGEAVSRAFGARKMNYECLGNAAAHVHWWLVPRPKGDPRPRGPIWENLDFLKSLWTEQRVQADVFDETRARLAGALVEVGLVATSASGRATDP